MVDGRWLMVDGAVSDASRSAPLHFRVVWRLAHARWPIPLPLETALVFHLFVGYANHFSE
jgi:hypothetical protein